VCLPPRVRELLGPGTSRLNRPKGGPAGAARDDPQRARRVIAPSPLLYLESGVFAVSRGPIAPGDDNADATAVGFKSKRLLLSDVSVNLLG
jgi:hypothetical protein